LGQWLGYLSHLAISVNGTGKLMNSKNQTENYLIFYGLDKKLNQNSIVQYTFSGPIYNNLTFLIH